MPTPQTGPMRLGDDLIDAARRALGYPDTTPVAQIVRAALRRLVTGDLTANGEPDNRGGRPPKDKTLTRK